MCTRVVEKCLGFAPVLRWCDELPDETLNVLISPIVEQTEHQDDTADRLHVAFTQTPLTSGVGQDVLPATPTGEEENRKQSKEKGRDRREYIRKLSSKVYVPIDEQVLLHPETVGASVASSTVAVGAPGGPRLSGVGRRILIVAVIGQVSTFTS